MKFITNSDIKTLKRRRDHLLKRMDERGKADSGYSFDKREVGVLTKVIEFLELQPVRCYGEETDLSD